MVLVVLISSLEVVKHLWCQSSFQTINGGGRTIGSVIEALSMHTELKKLQLNSANVGRSECIALENLLRLVTKLHQLSLFDNEIDDEGVDALVGALANSRLSVLSLSWNQNITTRGWQSLAAPLENPKSNLEEQLHYSQNNIGNEGALIFANALISNHKLKTLNLADNGITAEGWSNFSTVLCDTSSINNT